MKTFETKEEFCDYKNVNFKYVNINISKFETLEEIFEKLIIHFGFI